jgi:hypothetical protein
MGLGVIFTSESPPGGRSRRSTLSADAPQARLGQRVASAHGSIVFRRTASVGRASRKPFDSFANHCALKRSERAGDLAVEVPANISALTIAERWGWQRLK